LEFSPSLVFFVILPPIILDAGYTLKRRDFFHNLGTILLLAILGTLINCVVFGYLMYGFAKVGWVPLDKDSPLESLLFGAVVSATDPVAVLAMLGAKEVGAHPLLYSLVFGESVLNDAIGQQLPANTGTGLHPLPLLDKLSFLAHNASCCLFFCAAMCVCVAIVLFKTFDGALPRGGGSEGGEGGGDSSGSGSGFGVRDLFLAMGTFIGVSLGSLCVGIGVALLCCFIFKRVDLSHFPIYEFTLVTLFAYLSYFMAEMMFLSGIMSIFFCSVCLAHYNYYNISTNAQIATQEAFKSIAQICECFVFASVGRCFLTWTCATACVDCLEYRTLTLFGFLFVYVATAFFLTFSYIGITGGLSIQSAHLSWSVSMIVLTIVCCLLARATNVFPLCTLANMRRNGGLCKSGGIGQGRGSAGAQIPFKMMIPLWFAGLRGAVAFALALSFGGAHIKFVVSSTLMLVLFTTIVGGGLTLPILRWTGMAMGDHGAESIAASSSPHANGDGHHAVGSEGAQFELLEGSGPSDGQDDDDGFVHEDDEEDDESKRDGGDGDDHERSIGTRAKGRGVPRSGSLSGLARGSSHRRYTGLVARFKAFDKNYMRVWFGGQQSARGRSTGLIDEYGAPVLLAGDQAAQQQQEEMIPLGGHEGLDPELVRPSSVNNFNVAPHVVPGYNNNNPQQARSLGSGISYLNNLQQPRFDPASPASHAAAAGLAAPLGATVPAYAYLSPSPLAASASFSSFPPASSPAGVASAIAAPGALSSSSNGRLSAAASSPANRQQQQQSAGPRLNGSSSSSSPTTISYRQDEDELKSIFNSNGGGGGGGSGAVPVSAAGGGEGGAYVPPSFNRDSAVPSPSQPALMQDEQL
jgi:sodium/hydrogen exchanger 8